MKPQKARRLTNANVERLQREQTDTLILIIGAFEEIEAEAQCAANAHEVRVDFKCLRRALREIEKQIAFTRKQTSKLKRIVNLKQKLEALLALIAAIALISCDRSTTSESATMQMLHEARDYTTTRAAATPDERLSDSWDRALDTEKGPL